MSGVLGGREHPHDKRRDRHRFSTGLSRVSIGLLRVDSLQDCLRFLSEFLGLKVSIGVQHIVYMGAACRVAGLECL